MSVATVFARLLRGEGTDVVVECRHCGTTVAPDARECPSCERREFSRYEIPA